MPPVRYQGLRRGVIALSQRPSPERANAKIGRLRLGYCAREGCESYNYRVVFLDYPPTHWPEVLAQAESLQTEARKPGRSWVWIGSRLAALLRPRLTLRVWIVLAVALLLLLARHWQLGGTIPLVREPENFRVDPLPQETPSPSAAKGLSQ